MKTICKQLTVLLFALSTASVFGQDTNKMVVECYPLNVRALTAPFDATEVATNSAAVFESLKEVFTRYGVTFPQGSYIYCGLSSEKICMKNTVANHEILRGLLSELQWMPTSVELDASFVAFDLPDIEAAARKNLSAAPTKSQIAELWKSGKGRLLGTQKLITCSGVNAQSQGVDEQIYPTEFVDGSDTNTAATRTPPTPASLETRETGMIVNVTPSVQPNGRTIDLVLAPELSEGDAWDDLTTTLYRGENDEENLTVRQPRFHTAKITTTIVVDDGATSIQGGMASRDGQSLIYLFITARLIDTKGNPIHPEAAPKGQGETPKAK
jgi:hypothetical protein